MRDVTIVHEAPNLTMSYAKAAIAAARPAGDELPSETLEQPVVDIDADHVAAYTRTCGLRLRHTLPPTYLHVAAFPLAVALMARPGFPFALPGLVHVGNRIVQHRPLRVTDRPSLQVETRNLRPHRKGRQFDVLAEARVDGQLLWEDVSTYLARGRGRSDDAAEPGPRTAPQRSARALVIRVPAATGRRYAAVSGDRNPIHLSAATARPFGFPRAIAHGMWTAARCLAALEGRLAAAMAYDVRFERPVLLPATVALTTQAVGDRWRLALHSKDRDDRHLTAEAHAV